MEEIDDLLPATQYEPVFLNITNGSQLDNLCLVFGRYIIWRAHKSGWLDLYVDSMNALKLEKIARIERLSARERDSRNQSTKKTHATYCPNQRARRYMRVYL